MVILLKLYKRTDIEELLSSISSFIYIDYIYIHIDYSDNETIELLKNILYKTLKLPFEVYVSESNLGCSNAHKNALKWVFSFKEINKVWIIEDDLKLIKEPSFCYKSNIELYVLSEYFWSFIIDRSTYEYLESFNLQDLHLLQIHKDLLNKLQDNNQPLIWDAELELKLNYNKFFHIPINREICFESTRVPSTRSNETLVYVTYKNGVRII